MAGRHDRPVLGVLRTRAFARVIGPFLTIVPAIIAFRAPEMGAFIPANIFFRKTENRATIPFAMNEVMDGAGAGTRVDAARSACAGRRSFDWCVRQGGPRDKFFPSFSRLGAERFDCERLLKPLSLGFTGEEALKWKLRYMPSQ